MITENLLMRAMTFLQQNFTLIDISDYTPTHFVWKYSGCCIHLIGLLCLTSASFSLAFVCHETSQLKLICFCTM